VALIAPAWKHERCLGVGCHEPKLALALQETDGSRERIGGHAVAREYRG
jgi:hypothetical protein